MHRPTTRPESTTPASDSFFVLLGQLAHAVAARVFARLPPPLVDRIIAVCAFVALVSPLLLWISWSRGGLVLVLCIGLGAVAVVYLLISLHPDDPY